MTNRSNLLIMATSHQGNAVDDFHDCAGFIVRVLVEAGILEKSIETELSQLPGARRTAFLRRLLDEIASPVDLTQLRGGDLLFSVWRDTDRRLTEEHHMNFWMGKNNARFGTQMQCLKREHGGTGRICEVPLSALDWSRITRVYRLRALEESCQE